MQIYMANLTCYILGLKICVKNVLLECYYMYVRSLFNPKNLFYGIYRNYYRYYFIGIYYFTGT